MRHLFALLFFYFLAVLTSTANAQVVPVGFPVTQVGNQIYFGPTAVTSANVGQFTFAPAPAGTGVAVSAGRRVATGASSGEVIDVVAKTVVPRANVATALIKAAVKFSPYVQVASAGYELWKLLKDNEIEGITGLDGAVEFQQLVQRGCPGGIAYRTNTGGGIGCTPEEACASVGGTIQQVIGFPCLSANANYGAVTGYSAPPLLVYQPMTPEQVARNLENKPFENHPSLTGAIRDATSKGESIPAGQPTSVTGPSSGPSGSPTTTVNADGSKTVSTPSTSITYGPNTITINNVTTVTNVNSSGVTTGTSTTTAPANKPLENGESKEDEPPPVDTPFGPLPTLYTPVYPNGFDGIFEAKKAAMLASPLGSLSAQLMPTGMVSGTCPSWPLDLTFGSWAAFGVHNVAPPCWVWDFGKVVIILSAMLLARALIFGG